MEKYYPAVFLSESDGRYSVTFPDLPEAMTYGENFEDAMEMAEECLGLCLEGRRKHTNADLKIDGILLTLMDKRTNLARNTVETLRENFGSHIRIYRSAIPVAVKAAEAALEGTSIYAYEPSSKVSKAYADFTREVLADGRQKERLHAAHEYAR